MKLDLGDIEETVFYSSGDPDVDYEILQQEETDLVEFCIDPQGRVRRATGIVNMGGEEDNPDYVPAVRYEIKHSAWNSHSQYVELCLPNPANNSLIYHLVRRAMLEEFQRRLQRQIKNAKARLKRK